MASNLVTFGMKSLLYSKSFKGIYYNVIVKNRKIIENIDYWITFAIGTTSHDKQNILSRPEFSGHWKTKVEIFLSGSLDYSVLAAEDNSGIFTNNEGNHFFYYREFHGIRHNIVLYKNPVDFGPWWIGIEIYKFYRKPYKICFVNKSTIFSRIMFDSIPDILYID